MISHIFYNKNLDGDYPEPSTSIVYEGNAFYMEVIDLDDGTVKYFPLWRMIGVLANWNSKICCTDGLPRETRKKEREKACTTTSPIDHKYPVFMKMVERDAIVLPIYNNDINMFFVSKSYLK